MVRRNLVYSGSLWRQKIFKNSKKKEVTLFSGEILEGAMMSRCSSFLWSRETTPGGRAGWKEVQPGIRKERESSFD